MAFISDNFCEAYVRCTYVIGKVKVSKNHPTNENCVQPDIPTQIGAKTWENARQRGNGELGLNQ